MKKEKDCGVSRRTFLAEVAGVGLAGLLPGSISSYAAIAGPDYAVAPLPLSDVYISDAFWSPRIHTTRTVSLPYLLEHSRSRNRGTDGRLIEAASYFLAKEPDPVLRKSIEDVFEPTIRSVRSLENVWPNTGDGRFLQAGHFFEGAIAYYQATGDRKLLDVAIEVADNLNSEFGPGKRYDISNHEGIELALIKLYRVTGNRKYVTLAKFILSVRGTNEGGREMTGSYAQDHEPVATQTRAIGHCVRATYLYNAMADIAALTDDRAYARACQRIWQDAITKRTYLTGSIGSYRNHENYGDDYDLPNMNCWNEVCASVGNTLWNHRMFLLTQNAQYIDVLERILFNGLLAGVSLSGNNFLYQTPLKTGHEFARQPWFGPNCCPPNITRLIAEMGTFIYARGSNSLYVNLFIGSNAKLNINDVSVNIEQHTGYPWNGDVRIAIKPTKTVRFPLFIRIPGWAQNRVTAGDLYNYDPIDTQDFAIAVNGKKVSYTLNQGYAHIDRTWTAGDLVELAFPMPIRKVRAHSHVLENFGRVALERGPLVYCAETIDNPGGISNLVLLADAKLKFSSRPELLDGLGAIKGTALRIEREHTSLAVTRRPAEFTAIPYYAFGNRGKGEMEVWLATDESKATLSPALTIASTSIASSSCGSGTVRDNYPNYDPPAIARRWYPNSQDGSGEIRAISDQVEPVSSEDGSAPYLRLRPQSGNKAWVQYDFSKPSKVSSVSVYWKADKQFCVLPESWSLLYKEDNEWKPVKSSTGFPVEKDKYIQADFLPVTTTGLRLDIQLQEKIYKKGELGPPDANYLKEDLTWYEGGLIEWRVDTNS